MHLKQKLIPRAFVCMVLAGTAAAVVLKASRLSAQQTPATTPPPGGYQGWVHRTFDDGNASSTFDWNTRTGSLANISGNGDTLKVNFRDAAHHKIWDYNAATGALRTNDLTPEIADPSGKVFLTSIDDLLASLREAVGEENVSVSRTSDHGLERYDFTLTFPPMKHLAQITARGRWLPLYTITTAWVHPGTGLLAKVAGGNATLTFTYGAPEIDSIYDLGVPRDAKVVNNRPTADAIAVYDRMQASLRKEIPDGILITIRSYQITLYCQHGVHWAMRNYQIRMPDPNSADGVEVPADWQTTGADELFNRLALAMPSRPTAATIPLAG